MPWRKHLPRKLAAAACAARAGPAARELPTSNGRGELRCSACAPRVVLIVQPQPQYNSANSRGRTQRCHRRRSTSPCTTTRTIVRHLRRHSLATSYSAKATLLCVARSIHAQHSLTSPQKESGGALWAKPPHVANTTHAKPSLVIPALTPPRARCSPCAEHYCNAVGARKSAWPAAGAGVFEGTETWEILVTSCAAIGFRDAAATGAHHGWCSTGTPCLASTCKTTSGVEPPEKTNLPCLATTTAVRNHPDRRMNQCGGASASMHAPEVRPTHEPDPEWTMTVVGS